MRYLARRFTPLVLLLLLAPAFVSSARAQSENVVPNMGSWDGRFAAPGVAGLSGNVREVAEGPNGEIYLVGQFSTAGGLDAYGVAMWDGSAWHALGEGESNGLMSSVAVADDGMVYVGGKFDRIRGVEAHGVAMWDGTAWSAVGSGFDEVVGEGAVTGESVNDLAIGPDGRLYAAGFLTTSGGTDLNNVAVWDGTSWSDLGAGFFNNAVITLAITPEGALYAGGLFTFLSDDGTQAFLGVAYRAPGGSWTQSAHLLGLAPISDITVAPDGAVYVGGAFTGYDPDPNDNAGSNPVGRMIYAPNGDGAWTWFENDDAVGFLKDGGGANVNGIDIGDDGTVYFLGEFDSVIGFESQSVVGWKDGSFTDLGGPDAFGGVGQAAVETEAGVFVAGLAVAAGDLSGIGNIARWTGTRWLPLGAGLSNVGGIPAGTTHLTFGPDGSAFIAGSIQSAGARATNGLAAWDGTAWETFSTGNPPTISRVAVAPDGTIYGGGRFSDGSGPFTVGRWNGASWDRLDDFILFLPNSPPEAMAVDSEGRLFVSNLYTNVGGQPVTGFFQPLAMYDGSSWSLVADINGNVDAILFDDAGRMIIGGPFDTVDGVSAEAIARFDGTTWSGFGRGLDDRVTALAVDPDGTVYAGGEFERALPMSPFDFTSGFVNYVARWDSVAGEWLALDSGLDDHVNALAVGPDGVLYAGGKFEADSAGVMTLQHVAAWDTTAGTWNALGTGLDQPATAALYEPEVGVYFAGALSTAGGTGSSGVALWLTNGGPVAVERPEAAASARFTLGAAYPNPSGGRATLPFLLAEPMHARLAVYDLLGREVAVVVDAQLPAGSHAPAFDGTGLSSGLYVYRLQSGDAAQQRGLFLVR